MEQLPELVPLVVALALGAAVGWERELENRPAGFRTHALVALGAAMFTIVSREMARPDADPTRIAAQIVTGVGFLGAGAIMRGPDSTVRGLTTAASVWLVAAIGMACGVGLYVVAVAGAGLGIFVLEVMDRVEKRFRP